MRSFHTFPRCAPAVGVISLLAALAVGSLRQPVAAQTGRAASPSGRLDSVLGDLNAKLDTSIVELKQLRDEIQAEQVPMSRELNELEDQLIEVRKEYDRVARIRDSRDLDSSNMKSQIKSLTDQNTYLGNLLDDYLRNFESRIHVTELQRYRKKLEQMRSDVENPKLSAAEKFESKFGILKLSVTRLEELAGGVIFEGSAVAPDGVIKEGKFMLFGPVAYFASKDGITSGLVESKLGSLEPNLISLPEINMGGLFDVAKGETGIVPLDVSRGNAIKIVEEKETLLEHILKGGVVMYPIIGLFCLALLVALAKWIQLSLVQGASTSRLNRIMQLFDTGKNAAAQREARKIRGPVGDLLATAISHASEPRELLEEIIYEKMLHAKTALNRFIPFIGIVAAAAPLLGLLGTVTGMINTFKLITVFGTGDAQTFSSGIAEALITTEWGLIVAIPSLLLSAFLGRKARAVLDNMEKLAVAFMNHLKQKGRTDGGDLESGSGELPPRKHSDPPLQLDAPNPQPA